MESTGLDKANRCDESISNDMGKKIAGTDAKSFESESSGRWQIFIDIALDERLKFSHRKLRTSNVSSDIKGLAEHFQQGWRTGQCILLLVFAKIIGILGAIMDIYRQANESKTKYASRHGPGDVIARCFCEVVACAQVGQMEYVHEYGGVCRASKKIENGPRGTDASRAMDEAVHSDAPIGDCHSAHGKEDVLDSGRAFSQKLPMKQEQGIG